MISRAKYDKFCSRVSLNKNDRSRLYEIYKNQYIKCLERFRKHRILTETCCSKPFYRISFPRENSSKEAKRSA